MTQIQVELQDWMGNDKSVAESAWTSSLDYQKKQTRTDADVARVVNMLADSKHSTPFESVVLRWWIKMPVAIDRQFMTHRLQSANGMSGRYRTMPFEYLNMPDDVKKILEKVPSLFPGHEWEDHYEEVCHHANNIYNELAKSGKAAKEAGNITSDEYKRIREFYRGVLPQHNMTERTSLMNLRAWANFYKLRSKPDAQPEIQQVANLMLQQLEEKQIAPVAIEALKRNNWTI